MENIFNKILLGLNIKHLRKANKLTQGELCKLLGVNATRLSNWEVGLSTPDLEFIVKISNYFGISLQELVLTPNENWNTNQDKQNSGKVMLNESVVENSMACKLCAEKSETIKALKEANAALHLAIDKMSGKKSSSSDFRQTA